MKEGTGDVSALEGKQRETGGGIIVLAAVTVVSVIILCLLPPVSQTQSYHHFADERSLLGVPNFMNVVSNAGFFVAGVLGMFITAFPVWTARGAFFIDPLERWPYAVLFLGVALTAFGSSYYHLAPSDGTLLWDRLPMTLIFASFLSVTAAERINVKAGLVMLLPLVITGVCSVVYWYTTQQAGHGDLRPYIFMQFYPMIAIPLMLALFPPRYTKGAYLLFVIAIYGCAKALEIYDSAVFTRLGFISGHTLKHLISAAAIILLLPMLRGRKGASPQAAR